MGDRDLTVYRATGSTVLQRWHEVGDALKAWQAEVEAVFEQEGLGGDRPILYGDYDGRVLGVSYDGGPIPDGWRVQAARLTPHRGTREGKRIANLLDAIVYPDPRVLPGMPKHARPHGAPGLLIVEPELVGDTVFARWANPIEETHIDLTMWRRAKLSEYYLAKEAAEGSTS